MAVRSENWSVIILGRWNRSILTPERIGKRIFGLEDPQNVDIMVPLDGVSPYLVKHPQKGIIVSTEGTRLQVQPEKPDYDSLRLAMEAGVEALKWLPETPVTAAGVNVNFRAGETTADFARFLQSTVDGELAKLERTIIGRSVSRSVRFEEGRLNIGFAQEGDEFRLNCNFHRDSSNLDQLKQWLCTPVSEIERTVNGLLVAFDLEVEEHADVAHREPSA